MAGAGAIEDTAGEKQKLGFSVTSYACKSISMWAFPLRQ